MCRNRRPRKRETWTIYGGDTTTVAKEFLYNAQNPGGTPIETKNFAYDPSGNLIVLSLAWKIQSAISKHGTAIRMAPT